MTETACSDSRGVFMDRAFRKEKGVTGQELFKISAELFQQKGFRGTSMRDISSALGIKTSSIYHYINSKDDLLKKICFKTMNMLLEAGQKIASEKIPPEKKLQRLVESHVTLICNNLDLFTVTLRELTPTNAESFWEEIIVLRDRYEGLIRDIILEGKEKGIFRDMDEKMAAFALLGMMNWLIRWYSPKGSKSPGEIADLWVEIFTRGVVCK